jgi:hypothetical protein
MKSFSTPIQQNALPRITTGSSLSSVITIPARAVLAGLGAAVVSVAFVMFSVWVAGLETTGIVAAATWGAGFVFFALAVDNRARGAFLQLGSGAILLLLAWLQNTVSPEFTIVSGVLVAGWLAVATFRQLR